MKKFTIDFFSGICNPNPCSNGGLCIEESDGKSTCTCLDHFTGDNCELTIKFGKSNLILPSNVASFIVLTFIYQKVLDNIKIIFYSSKI